MKVFLNEITELGKDYTFSEKEPWVREKIEGLDEVDPVGLRPQGLTPVKTTPPRPIQLNFNLRRVDEVIVVTGKIQTHIRLLCSRCGDSFSFPAQPYFTALYSKDPTMAGVSHLGEDTKGKKTPRGSRHGMARSTHRPTSSSSHRLEDQDIDITYLTEDFIDLGDILAEQLQLQIPYKPLCNADPDRKGKACHPSEEPTGGIELEQKIADRMFRESPFSVLKGIKVKDSR